MATGNGDRSARRLWGLILEVVGAIGSLDDPDEFGRGCLEALAAVVDFDLGSYNEVDPAAGRATYRSYPEVDPAVLARTDTAAFPELLRQNPLLRYQHDTGDGSAHRISEFLTSDELHRLELYQRVYRPLGVEYQAALGLPTKEPLVVAFALNRSARDFDDDELVLLDALRPHLAQAYRNTQALATLSDVHDVLAEEGRGVLLLSAVGGRAHAASWVVARLEEHFGRSGPGGLPEPVRRWVTEERAARLPDGRPRLRRPLASVVGDRQLVVRLLPGSPSRPDALVVEEQVPSRGAEHLRRLGLTAREAELLWMLTRGVSTVAAASQLRVSPATVSKHLEHIYRKLGVADRLAAVAAASDAVFSRG